MIPLLALALAGGALFAHATSPSRPVAKPSPPAPPPRVPLVVNDVTSRDTLLYTYQDVEVWASGASATLPYEGKQVPKGIVVSVRDAEAPVSPMFWGLPKTQGWHYVRLDGDVAEALFGGPVEGFLPPHSLENA